MFSQLQPPKSRTKPLSLPRAKRRLSAIEAQQQCLLRTLADFADDELILDRLLDLEHERAALLKTM